MPLLPALPPPRPSEDAIEAARRILAEMESEAKKTATITAEMVEDARRARIESKKMRETQRCPKPTGS